MLLVSTIQDSLASFGHWALSRLPDPCRIRTTCVLDTESACGNSCPKEMKGKQDYGLARGA